MLHGACASGESGASSGGTTAAGASGGGAGGSGGTGASGGTGGSLADASSGGTGATDAEVDACAAETIPAEPAPLDVYVLLDGSSGMSAMVGGVTKWDAIKSALATFATAPETAAAKMAIGLGFFPVKASDVPLSCTYDAVCGTYGPCQIRGCDAGGGTLLLCDPADNQCPGTPCQEFGTCPSGGYCFVGTNCGLFQPCQKLTSAPCMNPWSCTANDYTKPAVTVQLAPTVSGALTSAMDSFTVGGKRTTGPALQGAIDYARQYATANAGHRMVTVLATGAAANRCSPTDAAGLAAIAKGGLDGSPSVPVFAVGVLDPVTEAALKGDLDTIAAAGGTQTAIVVDATKDVTAEFVKALEAVRSATLSCEYALPTPEAGQIDHLFVNVQFTDGAGVESGLGWVSNAAECHPTKGGWYYDVDPSKGTPSKILLCDASCDQIQGDAQGKVDVLVGCKTEVLVH